MRKILITVIFYFVSTFLLLAGPNEDLWKAIIDLDSKGVVAALAAGADANNPHPKWASPLNYAASFGDVEMITALLNAKAVVDAEAPGTKFTPLISAVIWGNAEAVKLLIAAGANVKKQALGGSVLTHSFSSSSAAVVQLLLAGGADVKSPIPNTVGTVTINNDVLVPFAMNYRTPAEKLASIQSQDWSQIGIKLPARLSEASAADFSTVDEVLTLLIKAGANPNGIQTMSGSKFKKSALAFAYEADKSEIVEALINAGADKNGPGVKEAMAIAKANSKPAPFNEVTSNPSKIKVAYDFPREGRNANGAGYSANLKLLPKKPTRIALISYYVYDAGSGKASGGSFAGSATTTVWRTPDYWGQGHVDGFYKKSIDAMKLAYKEAGLEILTPAEFLNSEEKKNYFYEFNQESAKREKSAAMIGKLGTYAEVNSLKICPTGQGYRPFFVANEELNQSSIATFQGGVFSANRKLTSNLGYELCKALEVDAVLVVYIATRKLKATTQEYGVNAVVSLMLGPNPGKADEADADAKNLGQFYCGTRTVFSSPELFQVDKAKPKYDGIDNVLVAHAKKMSDYINGKDKD